MTKKGREREGKRDRQFQTENEAKRQRDYLVMVAHLLYSAFVEGATHVQDTCLKECVRRCSLRSEEHPPPPKRLLLRLTSQATVHPQMKTTTPKWRLLSVSFSVYGTNRDRT